MSKVNLKRQIELVNDLCQISLVAFSLAAFQRPRKDKKKGVRYLKIVISLQLLFVERFLAIFIKNKRFNLGNTCLSINNVLIIVSRME